MENKPLEILKKINISKVGHEGLQKQIKELKNLAETDYEIDDNSTDEEKKEYKEMMEQMERQANSLHRIVENKFPEALSSKVIVTRKTTQTEKKEEKKEEKKPEPKKEEKKPEQKKKARKAVPKKATKVTNSEKKVEKDSEKKKIQVSVRPTDEFENVRNILEEADYSVLVKKHGKTTIKRKVKRQDRTIVKEKVENVFVTIKKEIPKDKEKEPETKKIISATDKLQDIFTRILLGIDKLVTNGEAKPLDNLLNTLQGLVQKNKFENGGNV